MSARILRKRHRSPCDCCILDPPGFATNCRRHLPVPKTGIADLVHTPVTTFPYRVSLAMWQARTNIRLSHSSPWPAQDRVISSSGRVSHFRRAATHGHKLRSKCGQVIVVSRISLRRWIPHLHSVEFIHGDRESVPGRMIAILL